MVSVILCTERWLADMLLAMRERVASDGCSVRLNGVVQLTTAGRGLNGRVQRFNKFNKTIISILFLGKKYTETRNSEQLKSCHCGVFDLWSEEAEESRARRPRIAVG